MFIGHFGVGLGAKRLVPAVSLGTLFVAAQFIDLLWPTLLQLGIEAVRVKQPPYHGPPLEFVHYPVSHSLLAVLAWAVLVGGFHYAGRRSVRAAVVLALAVLSHWLLDLLVHEPDLPLAPTGPARVGLGLWWWPVPELLVELAIFAVGAALYLRVTRARDGVGRWGLWTLLAFLVVVHLGNTWGPPPPSAEAVAWAGQAQWLLVLWAYWVDRHREPVARR
jgi:hypothetical protein